MKMVYRILMVALFLVCAPYSFADSEDDLVRNHVAAFMKNNDIPGVAVTVVRDGVSTSYFFGYADPKKKKAITKNTIFEIGSISKIMTSLLLAQQVDLARVGLDEPVNKYLTQLPSTFESIKLQDLATHTSGLPFDVPKSVNSRVALERYFASHKALLTTYPQKEWIYSNVGVGLLGYLLEAQTNKSFAQLFQSKILKPLQMKDGGIELAEKKISFLAQGYNDDNQPVTRQANGLFPAAYAVKASAEDMHHFLNAAIGLPGTPESILYPMRLTQSSFIKLQGRQQGLGWEINPIKKNAISMLLNPKEESLGPLMIEEMNDKPFYASDVLIDKIGTTSGFNSYIAVLPKMKSGIVILANKGLHNKDIMKTGRQILISLTHPGESKEAPAES